MSAPIETALVSEVAEGYMIAAMLQSAAAVDLGAELGITPRSFGVPLYQRVFTAIAALYADRREISLPSVLNELKRGTGALEAKDVERLRILETKQVTPGKVRELGPILIELGRKRILNTLGEWILQKSRNGSEPDMIIEKSMAALIGLGDNRASRGYRDMKKLTLDVITQQNAEVGKPLPTGIPALDSLFDGGMYRAEVTALAGETSRGKSCLAGNIMLHNAKQGTPVCYFTLEIKGEEIHNRLAAAHGGIDYRDIRRRAVKGNPKYGQVVSELAEMPMYIDDTVSATLPAMLARIRRVMREHAPELLIIDYIQKMSAPASRENRAHELGLITTALSLVAREYNNHVLVVSQLHRRGANDGKWPTLARLRESGRIEEDCSNVILLHRDEIIPGRKYNPETTCIVAKQRNGGLGVVKLGFDGFHQRFYEIPELKRAE